MRSAKPLCLMRKANYNIQHTTYNILVSQDPYIIYIIYNIDTIVKKKTPALFFTFCRFSRDTLKRKRARIPPRP